MILEKGKLSSEGVNFFVCNKHEKGGGLLLTSIEKAQKNHLVVSDKVIKIRGHFFILFVVRCLGARG